MVAAIHAHHGVVDKFIGDAVLAVFGLLGPAGERRSCGVSGSRRRSRCKRRLARYNEQLLAAQGITLRAGHRHPCRRGHRRLPGHPVARLEYTVIGHNVNLAARLEGKARAPLPSLLFSEAKWPMRVAKVLPVQQAGEVNLKGVASALTRVHAGCRPTPRG
jgi:adenylate cyclase